MSSFNRLHPVIQHGIVNELGWPSLRPLQAEAVAPILDGENALLLAPTAGGKTEAASFPLLSRIISEKWEPISILYICPIKALLNNLAPRLASYAGWIGGTVGLWHGDVSQGEKNEILKNPPSILLLTPESLEVLLTMKRSVPEKLFQGFACVVIDEIHAFAGDDRWWHLLSVVDRAERMSRHRVQRIGLSATVGNPDDLLRWLNAQSSAPSRVIAPSASGAVVAPDLEVDYVQSIENAAIVISQLHKGMKRLVFCDSRSRSEALANALRAHDVTTFVSHSSLSVDERRRAELAFAESRNCVIVATSTLELGIDVGDLDVVIQIDCPTSVASFLQRLGRTGRRANSNKNCLFLATSDQALSRTFGMLSLYQAGYVEPITQPALPYTVLAQQLMALCLQKGDRGRNNSMDWLPSMVNSDQISADELEELVKSMVDAGYLTAHDGLLGLGPMAERKFGFKNWMALFSVFSSPPMFTVLQGRQELGMVHEITFKTASGGPVRLSLGGRSWQVTSIDWDRRRAFVEPTGERGRSQWLGGEAGLHSDLCGAIGKSLGGALPAVKCTQRALDKHKQISEEHEFLADECTTLAVETDRIRWWTFGGDLLNAAIAAQLKQVGEDAPRSDGFTVTFSGGEQPAVIEERIRGLLQTDLGGAVPPIDEDAMRDIKFSECVPAELLSRFIQTRYSCANAWKRVSDLPLHVVHCRE